MWYSLISSLSISFITIYIFCPWYFLLLLNLTPGYISLASIWWCDTTPARKNEPLHFVYSESRVHLINVYFCFSLCSQARMSQQQASHNWRKLKLIWKMFFVVTWKRTNLSIISSAIFLCFSRSGRILFRRMQALLLLNLSMKEGNLFYIYSYFTLKYSFIFSIWTDTFGFCIYCF